MDLNTTLSVTSLGLSVLLPLLAFAFAWGKCAQILDSHQNQLTLIDSERRSYQHSTDQRLDSLEEKHDNRYLAVDREMVKVSTNMVSFEREMKDLKDTIKEFTKEMKEILKERRP